MPRLSVDIDLTYLPVAPRPESLSAIDAAIKRIAKAIKDGLRDAKVNDVVNKAEGIVIKLTVQRGDAQIKIEVTPVLRGCVFEPELMAVLGHTRMAASKMHRAKFVKAEMQGTAFMGIEAGDYQNPGWCTEIGNRLHEPAKGDTRPARCTGTTNGEERRHFVTHFIDANLTGADFTYANVQGADFSGATLTGASFNNATISRVSFKGVTGLKAQQLEKACVGAPGMSAEELECEQPYFTEDMQAELKKNPIFEKGIKPCSLRADGALPQTVKYSPIACPLPSPR
jgi:hypothetical protein